MTSAEKPVIAIIGGTGDLGSGLATGWAKAGYRVVIGSRAREKAVESAAAFGAGIVGDDNIGAARQGDVVVIAVPYASHAATLAELRAELAGKIVVDAVVPLVPPKVSTVQLPAEGSAALEARRILGPEVRLVSAFHNVGAAKLREGRAACDVLVFSDDKEARQSVIALAEVVAARGVSGGGLANSAAAEAMTSVLISINRQYKVDGAGLVISGLPAKGPIAAA